jgi:hypothetical protein
MRMTYVAFSAVVGVAACSWCTPPPAPVSPATAIFNELVDAGCLAPSSDGVQAVADEIDAGDVGWMNCLVDGGSIASCQVPCGADALKKR